MLGRVFLSHSWANKAFAVEVAEDLGRGEVILDVYDFSPGESIAAEIFRELADCSIFALMASPEALSSKWVALEIQEANSLRQSGIIKKTIVFMLPGATRDLVPSWLLYAKTVDAISPVQVANVIRHRQAEFLDEVQRPVFLNRHEELSRLEAAFRAPRYQSAFHEKVVTFYGQPGRGRRSLALKAFENFKNLRMSYSVEVKSGDNLQDIVIKLGNFAENRMDHDELQILVDEVRSESIIALNQRLFRYLSVFAGDNHLLLLEDAGGLTRRDGSYSEAVMSIFKQAVSVPGFYCGVICRRRPIFIGDHPPYAVKVAGLNDDMMLALAEHYAASSNQALDEASIMELARESGGQPLILRSALDRVQDVGVELVLDDLIQIRQEELQSYWTLLRSESDVEDSHVAVLVVLASYSPLPRVVLESATGYNKERVDVILRRLLDLVLVEIDSTKRYFRVSPDLSVLFLRMFSSVQVNHDAVARELEGWLRRDLPIENRLSLEQCLGRALFRSNRFDKEGVCIQFASDLVENAENAYDDQEWGKAVMAARAAFNARPSHEAANRILIQALCKLVRFDEARSHLREIKAVLEEQEISYFEGYIAQSARKFDLAIKWYRLSLDQGRTGFALHRDLALCYLAKDDVAAAELHLDSARASPRGRENRQVVDLAVRVAVLQHDEAKARSGLATQERVDRRAFYLQSLALVELAFANYEASMLALSKALESRGKLSFLGLAIRIINLIALGSLLDARREIKQLFEGKYPEDCVVFLAALDWRRDRSGLAREALMRYPDQRSFDVLRRFLEGSPVFSDVSMSKLTSILVRICLRIEMS